MTTQNLPTLNALLNGTAAVLLLLGWLSIRRGDQKTHRNLMVSATLVSAGFLTSYLIFHALHGSTPFGGSGWLRTVYFGILIPHTVLAAIQVPLILTTIALALRGRFERHRTWARITFPIWMFVSVTGVVIYLMLYHLAPAR